MYSLLLHLESMCVLKGQMNKLLTSIISMDNFLIAGDKRKPRPIVGQRHFFNCIGGFFLDLFTFLCCTD